MLENIVYPHWISKKMRIRFDNLEFKVDCGGFLYSPKSYNDEWDFQTKALWLRSVGMNPDRIAKKLDLNVNKLKNREFLGLITLDYEGKRYGLRRSTMLDWSNQGYVDLRNDRYIRYGGAAGKPEKMNGQDLMDGELLQHKHDILTDKKTPKHFNPSKDLYEEYYGDYKD